LSGFVWGERASKELFIGYLKKAMALWRGQERGMLLVVAWSLTREHEGVGEK
jgi:hypothetical protein